MVEMSFIKNNIDAEDGGIDMSGEWKGKQDKNLQKLFMHIEMDGTRDLYSLRFSYTDFKKISRIGFLTEYFNTKRYPVWSNHINLGLQPVELGLDIHDSELRLSRINNVFFIKGVWLR